jgi:hypothetical protein
MDEKRILKEMTWEGLERIHLAQDSDVVLNIGRKGNMDE